MRTVHRGLVAVAAAVAVLPGAVRAHALGGSRFDAPVPLPLLFAGAGVTVGATALWLGRTGRAPSEARLTLGTVPESAVRALAVGARAGFALLVLGAVLHGLVGRGVAAENAATLFVWPVWFRGMALLVLLAGNVWPVLCPWRALYDGLVALEGREIALFDDREWLGVWPAALGFLLVVGVLENLSVVPRSPRLTAGLVAGYTLWMVLGAVCVGPAWFRRADPLGAFYRLLGRVAPVEYERSARGMSLSLRPPWRGCLDPVREGGVVVLIVATVSTVSFDGLTATAPFRTVLYATRDALGTGRLTGVLLYLAGMAAFVAVFVATCRAVERLGGRAGTDPAMVFAPSVLPIAAGYEVAHNYPYVFRSLGRLVGVALEPLRSGLALEPLGWLPLPAFWGSQVLLIVAGHVVAVVAAHVVAHERYGAERATRAHLPLVVLMVGYTVLSLWIVSQPVVA